MKKNCLRSYVLILLITITVNFVNAQQSGEEEGVGQAVSEYFKLPRESIFLHLNKSKYVVGEDLWFKGYVYNRQTDLPFVETANVHVGLYDSIGKQLTKKLFRADDGYLKGSIAIDSTYTGGTYYIKATTSWMKNFSEDDSYVQPIQVLDSSYEIPVKTALREESEVHFLPEGGHLVDGVSTVVGVKAIDSRGLGIPIVKGIIEDDMGEQVIQFTSSHLGIGKFIFVPNKKISYKARVKFADGQEKEFSLPEIKDQGLVLRLTNGPGQSKVVFSVATNEATRSLLSGQTFFALIHSDGIVQRMEFDFKDKVSRVFSLDRDLLPKGINTITVFNGRSEPVAERLFYNQAETTAGKMKIELLSTEPDSLKFRLKIPVNVEEKANLSISVLPRSTFSYDHQANILSTFYLQPYIKGVIEDPSYYFSEITSKKLHELDALLLTQGWSRYSWNDMLWNPPKQTEIFEKGVHMRLAIPEQSKDAASRILVHRTRNHEEQTFDVPEEKDELVISNIFAERGESIYLSAVGKKGKLQKPGVYASILDRSVEDKLTVFPSYPSRALEEVKIATDVKSDELISEEKVIVLDEVTVEEERLVNDPKTNVNIPAFLRSRVVSIDQNKAISFPMVLDIIRTRYRVVPWPEGVSITSYRDGRSPIIYLDGVQIFDNNWIKNMPTTQLESYYFDRLASREGVRAARGEVIYLYTRRGEELSLGRGKAVPNNAFEFVVDKGFEPDKAYYNPKYSSYYDDAFEYFGVIHWLPDLETNEKGEVTFSIPNRGIKNISLFIEGMGDKGTLWSATQDPDTSFKGLERR
ncbi:hypothetical protein [Poritiphilus flavus]|uniref:MG2 domain-containing protein n=1 Tax=Poritiphilus flavus TaxID=2697053 RepID=A0A6L9E9U0_9FLAO|nr:hypothetical protein [Poritiphilus flavus]NAS11341.1 hypothetical protein [Poritiphilus flavus]